MNWVLLQNSLMIAAGTAVLATLAGFCGAIFVVALKPGWQKFLLASAVAGFALPPFLVVNFWLGLGGTPGLLPDASSSGLFSLPGVVFVLTLMLWPIALLAGWSLLHRLDSALLACDPGIRGSRLVLRILLPICRSGLLLSAGVIFVLAFNNFSVPALLQQRVLPAEIWIRFNTQFDAAGAFRLSLPLLVVPLLLVVLARKREFPMPFHRRQVAPALWRRQLGPVWMAGGGALLVLLISATLIVPLLELALAKRTWTELPSALAASRSALVNSLLFACVTAGVVGVAGWLLAGRTITGCGLLRCTTRMVVSVSLWLMFFVPGVLLGIALILLFNQPWTHAFYSSLGIVFLALSLRYLVLGWQTAALARRRANPRLLDAARLDAAGPWQQFRHALWPQTAPQLLAGAYLTYLLCLWDVETVLLITPPGSQTVSLNVFNLLHYGHASQVNALCFLLLVVAIAPLALFRARFTGGRPVLVRAALLLSLPFLPGCGPVANHRSTTLDSQVFSRAEVIGSRGVGAGQFNKPRSLTADLEGCIYVADMTGRVQKLTPAGDYVLAWQLPLTDLGKPKGMCRGKDGEILVIEPHYQRVNHFSTSGKLLHHWGRRGTSPGEFTLPRAVAVNSRGEIIVSEYSAAERVQVFDPQGGHLLRVFGEAGTDPGKFNRPEGLCVDSEDRIYVADSCNHRIQVFSRNGEFLRAYGRAGSGQGELSYPYDIRVDSQGRQYVCEFGNSRIQVFDRGDRPLELIGAPGSAPGQFNNPWSVALDTAGNLYVADALNHRVQKLVRRPGTT